MKLNEVEFLKVIELAPLFSIDLIVLNEYSEILVGKRTNPPAKEWWFVPGGRVYKGEALSEAFSRISLMELGLDLKMDNCQLLGVFEHFYDDSAFDKNISTHYINTPYLAEIQKSKIDAPLIQHECYRWVALNEFESDMNIHQYSKLFLGNLIDYLGLKQDG